MPIPGEAAADLEPDRDASAWAALKGLVIERTGLAYHGSGDDRLQRAVQTRTAALGLPGTLDYGTLLRDPDHGRGELDCLREALVVGETYFFRHAAQLEALCEVAVPHRPTRERLRIWSAGCASGPEPYSMAMLLRERAGDSLGSCHLEVLGTDVDRSALAAAETALYDAWKLRATPASVVEGCFERAGTRFRLRPAHRSGVRFAYHDLITEPFAPPAEGFDIILCRNVLIYFRRSTAERVVEGLRSSLAPGGWLALGHSEWDLAPTDGLERVPVGTVMLFRRALTTAAARRPTAAPLTGSAMRSPANRRPRAAGPAAESVVAAPPPPSARPERAPPAGVDGPTPVECDPLDASRYLARALQAGERGDLGESESMLRRCLYLDPDCALAHLHLGGLLLSAGRTGEARRRLQNADRLFAGCDDAAPVPGGEELTAGEAKGALRAFFDRLPT